MPDEPTPDQPAPAYAEKVNPYAADPQPDPAATPADTTPGAPGGAASLTDNAQNDGLFD